MNIKKLVALTFIISQFAVSCNGVKNIPLESKETTIAQEEAAILQVLNAETKAAFGRDYNAWQTYWVKDTTITKIYIDFFKNTSSEMIGWEKINVFVKTYMEKNPKPDPLPELIHNLDVRLYGTGAWVTYKQLDATRGQKKETRLMEKVHGVWKIAGMTTVIYGFE